jgi:DNA-binding IclR family transcriptional regulator
VLTLSEKWWPSQPGGRPASLLTLAGSATRAPTGGSSADRAGARFGYAYLSSLTLPEVAEPHLERLVAEVNESSSVSVLDRDDIVYVARTDQPDHDHINARHRFRH